jgi:hypothetical protein
LLAFCGDPKDLQALSLMDEKDADPMVREVARAARERLSARVEGSNPRR